jgi:hypothetical protein
MARGLTTVLLAFSLSVTASAQTRSPVVPPLPAGERIVNAPPLNVTLRLGASRVAIGEVPTFTVVIRNSGRSRLLLNPAAVANIQIFTQSGELVRPSSGGIADYFSRLLKRSDFIPLGPGQTHEFAVQPEYHARDAYSGFATYFAGSSQSDRRLKLSAGEYSVRLTYLAFPDYAASGYNVSEITEVWEGLVEAPSVPLTVLPPRDDEVQDAIAKIDGDDRPLAAIELVHLGRIARAIDPLLRLFARARDMRTSVAETVIAIGGSRAAPALIAAIAALPQREREEMVVTHAFTEAVRIAPDCAAVPLFVEATEDASRDVVAAFGDSLREIVGRCPELRIRLITLLRTPRSGAIDISGHGGRLRAAACG